MAALLAYPDRRLDRTMFHCNQLDSLDLGGTQVGAKPWAVEADRWLQSTQRRLLTTDSVRSDRQALLQLRSTERTYVQGMGVRTRK